MSVMVAGANDLSSSLAYTGICRSWQVSHSVQPQCGCSLRLWACEEQLFLSLVVLTGKQQLLGAAIMCGGRAVWASEAKRWPLTLQTGRRIVGTSIGTVA